MFAGFSHLQLSYHFISFHLALVDDPASFRALVICPWSQMVSGIYITGGLGGHGTGGFNDLWISEERDRWKVLSTWCSFWKQWQVNERKCNIVLVVER